MKDDVSGAVETGPISSGHRVSPGGIPHTQVHSLVRRSLENLQDVVAVLLMALLLVLSLQALWRLARMSLIEAVTTWQLMSEIVFVLILTEVYRLMIYYLSEHRISVALMVEVALVSTLREVMLKGAHEMEWHRLVELILSLFVLGGLLATERWTGRWRNEASEIDARRSDDDWPVALRRGEILGAIPGLPVRILRLRVRRTGVDRPISRNIRSRHSPTWSGAKMEKSRSI